MPKEPKERQRQVQPDTSDNTAGQLAEAGGFDTSVPFERPPLFSPTELAQLKRDDARMAGKRGENYPDIRNDPPKAGKPLPSGQRPIQESVIKSLFKLMKDEDPQEDLNAEQAQFDAYTKERAKEEAAKKAKRLAPPGTVYSSSGGQHGDEDYDGPIAKALLKLMKAALTPEEMEEIKARSANTRINPTEPTPSFVDSLRDNPRRGHQPKHDARNLPYVIPNTIRRLTPEEAAANPVPGTPGVGVHPSEWKEPTGGKSYYQMQQEREERAKNMEASLLKLMNYEVAPMQKINLGEAARGFGRGLMGRKWKTEDALSREEREAIPSKTTPQFKGPFANYARRNHEEYADAARQRAEIAEARHVSDHYRFNPDEAKGEQAAQDVRQAPMRVAERIGSEFNPGALEDAIRAAGGKGKELAEAAGGKGQELVESVKRFAQPESAYQPPSRPGIGEPTVDHIPYEYKSPREQNRMDLAQQSRVAGLRGKQENRAMAEDPSRQARGVGPMELSKILKSLENIMKAPADAGLQAQQRASRRQAGRETQTNIGQTSQAGHAAMGQSGQQAQSDAAQTQGIGAGIVDASVYALIGARNERDQQMKLAGQVGNQNQKQSSPSLSQPSGSTGDTQGTGTVQQTAGGGTDQQMDMPGTQTPTPQAKLNMEKPWAQPKVNVPQPKQTPTA